MTTAPEQLPRVFRVLPEPPPTPPLHVLHPISVQAVSKPSFEPVPHPLPVPPVLEPLPSEALPVKLSVQTRPPDVSDGRAKPVRKNCLSASATLPLPQATEIAPGHVWPPVKGRSTVAVATSGRMSIPETVQHWAPVDACELVSDGGWFLHTTERWLFTHETDARRHLLTLVRRLLPRVEVLAEGCSLAVGRHDDAWRMWLVTPRLPSVAEEAAKAIAEQKVTEAVALIRRVFKQIQLLRSGGLVGVAVPSGNAALFLCEGRIVCLPLDLEESSSVHTLINPIEELAQLLEPWTRETFSADRGIRTEQLELTRQLWVELKAAI